MPRKTTDVTADSRETFRKKRNRDSCKFLRRRFLRDPRPARREFTARALHTVEWNRLQTAIVVRGNFKTFAIIQRKNAMHLL